MTSPARLLLISDLHLEEARPELSRAFFRFLEREAGNATALYILGDFFNVWLGDDDDRPLNAAVTAALRACSNLGTAIYLMHGNRDFLLGESFARASGAALLPEPYLLEHDGQRYLLLHGDVLCTRDEHYLQFRAQVRDARWQQQFLTRPLAERRAFAEQARATSQSMNSNKAADIMDVTQSAVENSLAAGGVTTMIHGHTHRPQIHQFTAAGQQCRRIVLGDWGDHGWYVSLDHDGATLHRFALAEL